MNYLNALANYDKQDRTLIKSKIKHDNMTKPINETFGIAIIYNNKLLLAHPTNASWWGSYTIPKGHREGRESTSQTAIRETKEETGIEIKPNQLSEDNLRTLDYKDKADKRHILKYYILHIDSLAEIGLEAERIPKRQLQQEEIDYAGFLDLDSAKLRILKYHLPISELIKPVFFCLIKNRKMKWMQNQ